MANTINSSDGIAINAGADGSATASANTSRARTRASRMYNGNLSHAAAEGNQRIEILYRAVERFGVPVVLLAVVLWWARTDLIQPLMDSHFEFIDTIKQAHIEHTKELGVISTKLTELIEVSKDK